MMCQTNAENDLLRHVVVIVVSIGLHHQAVMWWNSDVHTNLIT
jgi:hypothetical protein